MQVLILILKVLITCVSAIANASKSEGFRPMLRPKTTQWIQFTTQDHHSNEFIRIARSGSKWVCETDIRPYFVSARNPLEAFDKINAKKFKSCNSEQTQVVDNRFGKEKRSILCWEDPEVRKVMQDLRKDCTPPAI